MEPPKRPSAPPGGIICEVPPHPPQKYLYVRGATVANATAAYRLFLREVRGVEVEREDISVRPIFNVPLKVDRSAYLDRNGPPTGRGRWMFRLRLRDRRGETQVMRIQFGPGEYAQVEAAARQRCQLLATDLRMAIDAIELEA